MSNNLAPTIYFVEAQVNENHRLLCQIVEHFFNKGKKVQIVANSDQVAQALDKLLWTFSQESFIPHKIAAPEESNSLIEPVVITVGEDKLDNYEILVYDGMVNLDFIKNYSHIIHFVVTDVPGLRDESRSLWKKVSENNIKAEHIKNLSSQKKNFDNLFQI